MGPGLNEWPHHPRHTSRAALGWLWGLRWRPFGGVTGLLGCQGRLLLPFGGGMFLSICGPGRHGLRELREPHGETQEP